MSWLIGVETIAIARQEARYDWWAACARVMRDEDTIRIESTPLRLHPGDRKMRANLIMKAQLLALLQAGKEPRLIVAIFVFVLTFALRIRGVGSKFILLGDQIR